MVAVALGTLILGEPFGLRLTIAIAIILTGMTIVTAKRTKAAPSTSSDKIEDAASAGVKRGEKQESAAYTREGGVVRRPSVRSPDERGRGR